MKGARWVNGILAVVVLFGLFVAAFLFEASLRAAQKVSIPVDSSLAPDVTITASRMPDFLWVGAAWSIDYQSPVPFELDIGSGSASRVPAGAHKIYSNHDHSNLDEYGLSLRRNFPEAIVARQTKP